MTTFINFSNLVIHTFNQDHRSFFFVNEYLPGIVSWHYMIQCILESGISQLRFSVNPFIVLLLQDDHALTLAGS